MGRITPALQSGKIDAIIAGMSPTAERRKEVDFSDPYYESQLVIVTVKIQSMQKQLQLRILLAQNYRSVEHVPL